MIKPMFQFKPFSRKALKVLNWWRVGSPVRDKVGIIAHGSVRSAKTVSFICSFLIWTMTEFKGKEFGICGKTLPALHRNVLSVMFKILNTWGVPYHEFKDPKAGTGFTIGTNRYYLFEFNNQASAGKIQGATLAGIFLDEVVLAPWEFVQMAMSRLSEDGAKFWFTCNPENPKHPVRADLIENAKEKGIYVLHFTMDDNLSLSEERREFYKKRYTGVFYQRYILGLWVAAEGAIYDMWDEAQHTTAELPDAPPDVSLVAIDYGTTNPTVFLRMDIHKRINRIFCSDEYYWDSRKEERQKTDAQYVDDLEAFIRRSPRMPAGVIVDPSAASFIVAVKARFKVLGWSIQVIKADNDVIDGIRMQQTVIASGIYRVLKKCVNTITDYAAYLWDSKAAERGDDAPVKLFDHTKDAERYFFRFWFFTRIKNRVEWMDNVL